MGRRGDPDETRYSNLAGVAGLADDDWPVPHAAWLWFARRTEESWPIKAEPATIRERLRLPPPWKYIRAKKTSHSHFESWPTPEVLAELEMIQDSPLERTR